MHVVVLHETKGDTLAVVDDISKLTTAFTEIDEKDSKGILDERPELRPNLQNIFKDVMLMYGFQIK